MLAVYRVVEKALKSTTSKRIGIVELDFFKIMHNFFAPAVLYVQNRNQFVKKSCVEKKTRN